MVDPIHFTLAPLDLLRRHFLVYDANFHKVGTCDRNKGVWLFRPNNSLDSFMGFSRDDAVRSWFESLA